jgi:hypothetical protein
MSEVHEPESDAAVENISATQRHDEKTLDLGLNSGGSRQHGLLDILCSF